MLGNEVMALDTDQRDVILTPDQRLRVFISSTLEELAPERAAARQAVEALHLSPVWYESGARPHPPRNMYRAYLRQSHVFVGIYWQRYGWVAPGMEVSGLEDEYRLADGMPKLMYLKRPAPEQEERLKDFLASVRDSGTVSYRAFRTPDELQRLLADDLALLLSESFGALRTSSSSVGSPVPSSDRVGNLPARLTSFVGRDTTAAKVRDLLRASRLVTLTGVGGVGKTRLAVEVAASLGGEYTDGCWLCELAPADDVAAVAPIVAAALGVSQRQGLSVEDSIVEHVGTRNMLIVLDNCEQVLEAAGLLAEHLLRRCPQARVLATSRQRLQIEGEQVWHVEPLAVADPTACFDCIASSAGVRLFAERAAAAQNDFVLDPGNATKVAEICARLDGIPLAIELAAARVSAITPAEMAGLLDQRFCLLTTGPRSAAQRHQTLRAVIDWSYSLLTADEQACFQRLGVFLGSFDTDAVTAVADVSDDPWAVRDLMASLVAKSMVVREIDPTGTSRYRLFESLRHYALFRIGERGELDGWRRRHAQYFAVLAERAGPELLGPDELCWRARLRADRSNLRAAVQWSLGSATDDGELAVRIAAALGAYALFEPAGDVSSLVELATERAELAPPALRAAVLGSASFAAFQNHGDVARAERLARAALDGGVPLGCPAPAHAYATMILVLTWAHHDDEARALGDDARATLDRIGASGFHRAMIRQATATTRLLSGDAGSAQAFASEALDLARRVAMPSGLTVALWAAGLTLVREQPERAMRLAEEAVELIRAGASDAVLGHLLAFRAQLRSSRGEVDAALNDLRESLEVSHGKGDLAMLTVGVDRAITVLGAAGESEHVATLAGVCLGGPLAAISTLPRAEREDRTAVIEQSRLDIGLPAFQLAYARGASLPADRVTSYVLDVLTNLTAAVASL
jgi:predicted ATPase